MTATTSRPARTNRLGLVLLGALLAAGGGAVIARGLGLLGRADGPIADSDRLTALLDRPWVGALVALVGVVMTVLALVWLLAQLPRRTNTGDLVLAAGGRAGGTGAGVTHLGTGVVADAVVRDVEAYHGVRSARAAVEGSAARPTLTLTVTVDPRADIGALRQRVHDHAASRLAQALEAEAVATRVLVTTTGRSSTGRVR